MKSGKKHQGCLLEDGSILDNLGSETGASINIEPFRQKLRPKTVYLFKVSVKSKIGDPSDPLTRLFVDFFFL